MKTQATILFLILVLSCGQSQKCKSANKSIEKIDIDTVSNLFDQKTSKVDTLSFSDLDSALLFPERVIHLIIKPVFVEASNTSKYYDLDHLPAKIGSLVNLKTLEIHCLEKLKDLPPEIGQLKNLQKLIIDNGNSCQMNISLPSTINQLQNFKELVLFGALDARDINHHDSIPPSKIKHLPKEIVNLQNLEILDLGRNGMTIVPNQVASLINLRILKLDYNNILEIPSFISNLKHLEVLNLTGNQKIKLPDSLSGLKNLKVLMQCNSLKVKDQKELKRRFPNIVFIFENEYINCNEEPTQ